LTRSVLDPPAFAKSKASVPKAVTGYKESQPARAEAAQSRRHARHVQLLVTNIAEAAFAEIVYEAAVDARVHVTVVEKRMQGRDHPVLLGALPETYYLKCFILRKASRDYRFPQLPPIASAQRHPSQFALGKIGQVLPGPDHRPASFPIGLLLRRPNH